MFFLWMLSSLQTIMAGRVDIDIVKISAFAGCKIIGARWNLDVSDHPLVLQMSPPAGHDQVLRLLRAQGGRPVSKGDWKLGIGSLTIRVRKTAKGIMVAKVTSSAFPKVHGSRLDVSALLSGTITEATTDSAGTAISFTYSSKSSLRARIRDVFPRATVLESARQTTTVIQLGLLSIHVMEYRLEGKQGYRRSIFFNF